MTTIENNECSICEEYDSNDADDCLKACSLCKGACCESCYAEIIKNHIFKCPYCRHEHYDLMTYETKADVEKGYGYYEEDE
jgi:hypothetical protein